LNSIKKLSTLRKEIAKDNGLLIGNKRLLPHHHHDPSRTLQPIIGFDLGLLQEQDRLQNAKDKKNKHAILKTHRFFSDLHDDEHHAEL
jgi:hypothetical protein